MSDKKRKSLKFQFFVPYELRTFHKFPNLSQELQDRIWELTLNEPGFNSMRLFPETMERMSRWFEIPTWHENTQDEAEDEQVFRSLCTLEPSALVSEGDISNYLPLRQRLLTLLLTCKTSHRFATSLMNRKDVMRKTNGNGLHSILSLSPKQDIFCIDYFNGRERQRGADFTIQPICSDFVHIRQVAVSFFFPWAEEGMSRLCPAYGTVHGAPDERNFPRHFYQFLARSFPNLEKVWLIDHKMLRRVKSIAKPQRASNGRFISSHPRSKYIALYYLGFGLLTITKRREESRKLQKYVCQGRTYYEADEAT
jgi:hypothetical protein